MKQQYLGDVNDYRKYCLLRHFANQGRVKIGVCWMLTPDDQGPDGRKTSYLDQPKVWRNHDPALFDLMQAVVHGGEQRLLGRIESSGVIPGAVYFDEITPDGRDARIAYMGRALDTLGGADLIFFDPDNGIEVASKSKGRKNSSKFLYWDEISDVFHPGRSLLIYQHFSRENRLAFSARLAWQLREVTQANSVCAIHSPHVLFLLASSDPEVIRLAEGLPARFGMWADLL